MTDTSPEFATTDLCDAHEDRLLDGRLGVAVPPWIALGAVIRGSTPHFDYVAAEVTKGLASVSLESSVPAAFGVLTVDSIEQAIERAGTKAGNKGWEAAASVIEVVSLAAVLGEAGL